MKSSGSIAPSVVIVAVLLALETILVTAVAVFLGLGIAINTPDSVASAWGLLVIAIMATGWIGTTTLSFIRGNARSRGSALVWQVLQAAVGLASNQGDSARPDIASGLFIPSLIVMVLLLSAKPIKEHLA